MRGKIILKKQAGKLCGTSRLSYTAPKMVALYGARAVLFAKTRLWPRHRLEEVPSLSSFHCPAGRGTVQAVSVGL